MNILADTTNWLIQKAGAFNSVIATKIYTITGLEDPYIIIGISTLFVIIPIVYTLIDTFTEFTSSFKLSLIILIITVSTVNESKENFEFIMHLEKESTKAGMISFILSIIFSIISIMQDPYYAGLFGRYRDDK